MDVEGVITDFFNINMNNIPTKKDGGYAMITAMIFFLAGSMAILGGVAAPTLNEVRLTRELVESKSSYSLAEGLIEDIVYRVKHGTEVSDIETITESNTSVSATISDISGGKNIRSVGDTNDLIRNIEVDLVEGDGVAFNYGVQADVGGIVLDNFSSINGNVYSNGPISGSNNNALRGDAVSVGPSGLIDGVNVTGSAYAHLINDATIDGDAYYFDTFTSSTAANTHPGTPDFEMIELPISDELISAWESAATSTVISSPCPYIIEDDITIGPVKINCDLNIKGNIDVTLEGAIWVVGDLTIEGTPDIQIGPLVGDKSLPIIADDPTNRTTGSKIILKNSAKFAGDPLSSSSYILVISQNESAELGGGEVAIDVSNSVSGDLLIYAGHGEILLQNNVELKEVSGYRIRLQNSTEVTYESGLINSVFSTGPGGGYTINSWMETE